MASPQENPARSEQRSRILVLASVAYVAAASMRAAEGRGVGTWALSALGLAIAWRATREKGALRAAAWGLAAIVASLGAPYDGGWIGAFAAAAALAVTIAARVAIARVAAPPGLAVKPASSPVPASALAALAWGLALVAHVAGSLGASTPIARHADACEAAAIAASALVLIGAPLWTARVRRLELGVESRMRAAAGLAIGAACVGWAAFFLGLASAVAAARGAIGAAATLVALVALRGDPVDIARATRRVLALAIVGGPVVMLGALVAQGRPWDAPAAAAIAGVVALVLGAAAPALEEPLRPARGAWLKAVERAHEALLRTDPDEAVREVLVALRAPAGASAESPELWTFDPLRALTVDAAGYAHEREARLPDGLVETASREPEATLRLEVLDALQVRRPDLRPLAKWMDDRGAMLATVVTRAGEPEGLLVLPRGQRGEALTLEEARAIKRLADALAALCHARAALARSLARERSAVLRAEGAEDALARAEHVLHVHEGRHALAAARLARPATVGVYSAASRLAFDALERRMRASPTVAIVAPSGVDPVPYVARAHLGGPRGSSPLVLVDGTSSREHDLARWSDPEESPLALADRGLLVLLDGAALPADVQRTIARALAERRPPWERAEPLDVALALTAVVPPRELIDAGRLDPALAARLGDALDAPIELPRLRERPEDIRSIVIDRLAREGLRVKGTPVGIEDAAFARFVEHPFEGEDAELTAIVQRLVAACAGDVVRAVDVDALGVMLPPGAIAPPPASSRSGSREEARGALEGPRRGRRRS